MDFFTNLCFFLVAVCLCYCFHKTPELTKGLRCILSVLAFLVFGVLASIANTFVGIRGIIWIILGAFLIGVASTGLYFLYVNNQKMMRSSSNQHQLNNLRLGVQKRV